jgi:hypothetical protein
MSGFDRHAGLSAPPLLFTETLMRALPSFERSSAVCTLRGVNSAFEEM